VNNPGTLSATNATICVGGSVSTPSLTNTTFNNGLKTQTCTDNCGYYWPNNQSITYTATNWWEPIRPNQATFPTNGTYIFTNKVRGITTDQDCPSPTAITNAGMFTVTVIASAPSISQQPTNQTVISGASVTFSVAAMGCPSPSYQWYFNTNTSLAGATNATLTLTNVQFSQAGNYAVLVTNISGSVLSSNAVLICQYGDADGDGLPDNIDADPYNPDTTAPVFVITAPSDGAVF
jgi:hypothetical protein